MQAFIKDNKLIINNMINESEKADLIKFINNIENKAIKATILYDIEGNKSGISFQII